MRAPHQHRLARSCMPTPPPSPRHSLSPLLEQERAAGRRDAGIDLLLDECDYLLQGSKRVNSLSQAKGKPPSLYNMTPEQRGQIEQARPAAWMKYLFVHVMPASRRHAAPHHSRCVGASPCLAAQACAAYMPWESDGANKLLCKILDVTGRTFDAVRKARDAEESIGDGSAEAAAASSGSTTTQKTTNNAKYGKMYPLCRTLFSSCAALGRPTPQNQPAHSPRPPPAPPPPPADARCPHSIDPPASPPPSLTLPLTRAAPSVFGRQVRHRDAEQHRLVMLLRRPQGHAVRGARRDDRCDRSKRHEHTPPFSRSPKHVVNAATVGACPLTHLRALALAPCAPVQSDGSWSTGTPPTKRAAKPVRQSRSTRRQRRSWSKCARRLRLRRRTPRQARALVHSRRSPRRTSPRSTGCARTPVYASSRWRVARSRITRGTSRAAPIRAATR